MKFQKLLQATTRVLAGLAALLLSALPLFGGQRGATVSGQVSYGRDIAPMLQMHCVSCHHRNSEWWPPDDLAGGLDLSTYQGLMAGGLHGRAIVPGSAPNSRLVARVTEDTDVRMPFLSPPLTSAQIDLLRRWIADGAKDDDIRPPTYVLEVGNVTRPADGDVSVSCRVLDTAFLEIEIIDAAGRSLWKRYASAKWDGAGYADKSPGEWISWGFSWHADWPREVLVRLTVSNVTANPIGTIFTLESASKGSVPDQLDFLPDPVNTTKDRSGRFRYMLGDTSDLAVDIPRDRRPVYIDAVPDIPPGLRYYSWNLKGQDGNVIEPGNYTAVFRFSPRARPASAVAVYFAVTR